MYLFHSQAGWSAEFMDSKCSYFSSKTPSSGGKLPMQIVSLFPVRVAKFVDIHKNEVLLEGSHCREMISPEYEFMSQQRSS